MKRVISDHFGLVNGFYYIGGFPIVRILTSEVSYETGEIKDVMLTVPYTGDVKTMVQILDDNASPKRVRIIIETED